MEYPTSAKMRYSSFFPRAPVHISTQLVVKKFLNIFIKTASEVAEKLLTWTVLSVTLYCPGIRIKILYINIS
jgi:hypothetical protein